MKRIYETIWQNIPFNSFTECSLKQLPGPSFYEKFYACFFKQYKDWSDLNPDWLATKRNHARFLMNRMNKDHTILSVGCGIGFIEKELLEAGYSQIEVQEMSAIPLQWIRNVLPSQALYVGSFFQVLPPEKRYDRILLNIIDYCFEENDWIELLTGVRNRLNTGGKAIISSVSLLDPIWSLPGAKRFLKDRIKWVLHRLGFRDLGQFWGFARTRSEFQAALDAAGLICVAEGFFPSPKNREFYWLETEPGPERD